MIPTPPLPPHLQTILQTSKEKYLNLYLAFYLMLGMYGFERACVELFENRFKNRYLKYFTLQLGTHKVICGYSLFEEMVKIGGVEYRRSWVRCSYSGGKTKTILSHKNLPSFQHLHPYLLHHFKSILPVLKQQFDNYNT